jgi:hypothetical protein
MSINYDELADAPVSISDDELKSIADLAERQIVLEDWIAAQEEKLKQAKQNLAKLTGELLPEALRAAGVSKFALANGCEIELNTDTKANITKANQEWCFQWLNEHDMGDLVKNEFKVTFGMGDSDQADQLAEHLASVDQEFNQRAFIHPQTLSAFVRRELEDNDHDEEWEKRFGVFRHTYTKIVRPG